MVYLDCLFSYDWINTIDWFKVMNSIASVTGSLILAYIAWITRKDSIHNRQREEALEQLKTDATMNPVADIELNNLPPYSDSSSQTEIIITNKGNCQMTTPHTTVSPSWMGNAILTLNWEKDDYLVPNEDKHFFIRLSDPPLDRGDQQIIVKVWCQHPLLHYYMEWTETFNV